jgi:hypothetical protein
MRNVEKIIAQKLEKLTLNANTTTIWLVPYTDSDNEPSVDIAEDYEELVRLVQCHEIHSESYHIIEMSKGGAK